MSQTLIQRVKSKLTQTGISRHSEDSRNWLFANIKKLTSANIRPQTLLYQPDLIRTKVKIGNMYMFLYDPKLKEQLPFYDRFPLVFVIQQYKDGFLGLNLHYLPPILRMKLFAALLEYVSNDRYDDRTRLRLTWRVLTNFARTEYAQVCVKRYLYEHFHSQLLLIPSDDWEVAVFLPTEQFKENNKKISRTKVWNTTRTKVL